MGYVDLNASNIEDHHLCCALGDPKHAEGVARKRSWLKRRFKEGLVFRKLDVRGKVFIEYAPAELAWRPIVAPGWLTIHCLWVSGRFAKQGHGKALLQSCLDDAKARGKRGVVIAAADRKRPFLSDPKFLKRQGFEVVDQAGVFRLYAKAVDDNDGTEPRFAAAVHKASSPPEGKKLHLSFTDQCPFNLHWSKQMKRDAEVLGFDVELKHLTRRQDAQRCPSPLGAFSMKRGEGLALHHLATTNALKRTLNP